MPGCVCDRGDYAEDQYTVDVMGVDHHGAEVTVLTCAACSRRWLRYRRADELMPGSGPWTCGPLTTEQAATVALDNAADLLERLPFWWTGAGGVPPHQGRGPASLK